MSQNRTPGSGPDPDDYFAMAALLASEDDAPEVDEDDEQSDDAMLDRIIANLGITGRSASTSSIDTEYERLTARQIVNRSASEEGGSGIDTSAARYECVVGRNAEIAAGYTGDSHLELEVTLLTLEPGITRVEAAGWVPRPPSRDLLAAVVFTDPPRTIRFPLRVRVDHVDGGLVHELYGGATVPTPGTITFATIETEAESMVDEGQISDEDVLEVLASWTVELGAASTRTVRAAPDTNGRLWEVRVVDPDLIAAVTGARGIEPLFMTVSDAPVAEGIAVRVSLPLPDTPVPGVVVAALIEYGTQDPVRIPLDRVDLGAAAAEAGLVELAGQAVVPPNATAALPVITLSVLGTP